MSDLRTAGRVDLLRRRRAGGDVAHPEDDPPVPPRGGHLTSRLEAKAAPAPGDHDGGRPGEVLIVCRHLRWSEFYGYKPEKDDQRGKCGSRLHGFVLTQCGMLRFCGSRLLTALVLVLVPTLMSAAAAAAAVPAVPIPEGPEAGSVPPSSVVRRNPRRCRRRRVPRHPFMAANGRSNIHDDAYQTDTYTRSGAARAAPCSAPRRSRASECASVTFDRAGRIVAVCVGSTTRGWSCWTRSRSRCWPHSTCRRAWSTGRAGNPFTEFSGGGYFYLDNSTGR